MITLNIHFMIKQEDFSRISIKIWDFLGYQENSLVTQKRKFYMGENVDKSFS